MIMFELVTSEPKVWKPFFEILDAVLTNGFHNTENFGRAEREYLFSYISRKNQCNYCADGHQAFCEFLGFDIDHFDPEILDLVNQLYSGAKIENPDDTLVKQIVYTISVTKFINNLVNAHNVQVSPLTAMKSDTFINQGYVKWYEEAIEKVQR